MTFPRYPEYKPSGVDVIGAIPIHWEVKPLRQLGRLLKGSGGSKEDVVDEGVPCVRYGDLYTTHRNFIERARTCLTEERAFAYTPIEYGDVLFAASGEKLEEIGKSAVNLIGDDARCGGDLIVLRPSAPHVARFLGYAADAAPAALQKASMGRGTTVKHIYPDELRHLMLALPPVSEQQAIADFLDRETPKIDALVAEQERLIELLKEKRQAVISHAVTKGLNRRAPMKDSGIEWLGMIPAHWETVQSRRLFRVRSEPALPDDVQLTASQKYGVIPQAEFVEREGRRVVEVIMGTDKLKHVEPDDFIISMRSFQGGIEWCRIRGSTSFHYVMLTPVKHVHPPYFAHLFKSRSYIQALQTTTDLIRDGQELRYSNFVMVDLPLVPDAEQKQIAAFLNQELARLDALADEAARAIPLLQERRTALIAAAVTGQIDVRSHAARSAA